MKIDIVIVTYNSESFIKDCLDSIVKFTPDPKSIYVVDNGSNDGTLLYLDSIKNVTVLKNSRNSGYAAAVNRGIQAGCGQAIAVFNADTRVTQGWLEPLLDCLKEPNVGIVGPKMINSNNQLLAVGTNWDWSMPDFLQENKPDLLNERRDCLVVNGACFLIKRENLETLGLLDENYFFYFEETDYCFNANYHGYRVVYCPDSLIFHEHDLSSRNKTNHVQYWSQSDEYFNKKWGYNADSRRIQKNF